MRHDLLAYREDELPVRSKLLSRSELIELCECPNHLLLELMELGWLVPAQSTTEGGDLYSHAAVYRIRKLVRICTDFELTTLGGTIVVDLLQRVDGLERKIQALEGALRGRE